MPEFIQVAIVAVIAVALDGFARGWLRLPRWEREEAALDADQARRVSAGFQVRHLDAVLPDIRE